MISHKGKLICDRLEKSMHACPGHRDAGGELGTCRSFTNSTPGLDTAKRFALRSSLFLPRSQQQMVSVLCSENLTTKELPPALHLSHQPPGSIMHVLRISNTTVQQNQKLSAIPSPPPCRYGTH